MGPETATRAFNASSFSSIGNVLAREPSDDAIDGNSICCQSPPGKFSDVSINRNLRPVLVEDADSEMIDFAERHSLKSARALQA
jgi:hypothetical protein